MKFCRRKKVKVTSNSSGRVGMSDIHMDRNNSAKQTINQEPEVDEGMFNLNVLLYG